MPYGEHPKSQDISRSPERGVRTGIIIAWLSPAGVQLGIDKDDGKSAELSLALNSMQYQLGRKDKAPSKYSNEMMFVVYETNGDTHVCPIAHNIDLKQKALLVVAKTENWIGRSFNGFKSLFVGHDDEVSSNAKATAADAGVGSSSAQWGSMVGEKVALSFDASGGLVISEIFLGSANPEHPTAGEQHG